MYVEVFIDSLCMGLPLLCGCAVLVLYGEMVRAKYAFDLIAFVMH